jgi:hypothetical protein
MKGKRYVGAVTSVLAKADLPPRRRLEHAAAMFWKAMFYEQNWPPDLRSRSAAIVSRLFADGPIQRTIERMNEDTVGELLIELQQFTAAFSEAASARSADLGPEPVN